MGSVINSFPGYEFNKYHIDEKRYTGDSKGLNSEPTSRQSIYMGEDPSEGGYVYANPGIYYNAWTFDVAGLHPASIIALNKFGKYTERYKQIRDARIAIKHHELDKAKTMLDGRLAKYLTDEKDADRLAKALKLVLNSTYGYCSATFNNPFKDSRDLDNIVAKRGALFMITLKNEVLKKGFNVIHCKTDSIKIVDPTQDLEDFIFEFGRQYGYEFEIESVYEKICLVNRAVYVAKERDGHWTATGTQFQVPYVFKTLFSKEPIIFEDLCETKSVSSALYLDFNENAPDGEHNYTFVGKVGLFCPMKPGAGGGWLMREKDGKYNSATGAKGYRWMEAEMVKNLGLEDQVDRGYYDRMVDEAVKTIEQFGDFEMFVSDDSDLPF